MALWKLKSVVGFEKEFVKYKVLFHTLHLKGQQSSLGMSGLMKFAAYFQRFIIRIRVRALDLKLIFGNIAVLMNYALIRLMSPNYSVF